MSAHRFLLIVPALLAFGSLHSAEIFDGPDGSTTFATSPRSYALASQRDLNTQSYEAQITVTVRGGQGMGTAFFGIGSGEPNPDFYDEPTTPPSLSLGIRPSDFTGGSITVTLNGVEIAQSPGPGDGTHRVRLVWNAKSRQALFEVHPFWEPNTKFNPPIRFSVDAAKLDLTSSQSFFCGGAHEVVFSDFSARPVELSATALNATAGNWLPAGTSARATTDATLAPVDDLLRSINGQVRLLANWYDGTRLGTSHAFANGEVKTPDTRWQSTLTALEIPGENAAMDLSVVFKLAEGEATNAGVAVAFDFTNWSTENFVFAPAMLYGGNRFRILPLPYPPYIYDPKDRPLDMPTTTTNILHLKKDNQPGLVEMLTSNLATPMMGFLDPKTKRGFLLLAEPKTSAGVSGMFVQEDPESKRVSLVVAAPGVRNERYHGSGGRAPSGDVGLDLKAGAEIALKFKVYNFQADDISAFLAKAFEIRKALTGPNTFRDVIPFSAAAEMIMVHQDGRKWYEGPDYGYFVNRASDNPSHSQIGWGGNPIYSHPPTIMQNPERLRRIGRTWDMLTEAQGKSGLFYSTFFRGKVLGDAFNETDTRPSISMVRRSGEVLGFGIQQLEVLREHGQGDMIDPKWESMLRRCADALVTLYDKYGQFGQFIDADTGEMEVNGSTAGAASIGALARASKYFNEPKFLKTAEAAGAMYYTRDLAKGYAGGAPAENLQSPDMEAVSGLADSYMVLYETTGDKIWLQHARDAINLLATWTVSYDYEFPPESDLGRVGANATGSIFASSANNHSSPGYYILSGDFMLKYLRATGDARSAELYKDTAHNAMQYVNSETNHIQRQGGYGFVSERVQISDWEGKDFGRVSDHDTNYAWECMIQLVSLQNPGIYLNTTTGSLLVLDHVKTELLKRDASGTVLKLTNTTPYDAHVSILAESDDQAKKPLGDTAFLRWPKVQVNSGESVEITVKPDGTITQ